MSPSQARCPPVSLGPSAVVCVLNFKFRSSTRRDSQRRRVTRLRLAAARAGNAFEQRLNGVFDAWDVGGGGVPEYPPRGNPRARLYKPPTTISIRRLSGLRPDDPLSSSLLNVMVNRGEIASEMKRKFIQIILVFCQVSQSDIHVRNALGTRKASKEPQTLPLFLC